MIGFLKSRKHRLFTEAILFDLPFESKLQGSFDANVQYIAEVLEEAKPTSAEDDNILGFRKRIECCIEKADDLLALFIIAFPKARSFLIDVLKVSEPILLHHRFDDSFVRVRKLEVF